MADMSTENSGETRRRLGSVVQKPRGECANDTNPSFSPRTKQLNTKEDIES